MEENNFGQDIVRWAEKRDFHSLAVSDQPPPTLPWSQASPTLFRMAVTALRERRGSWLPLIYNLNLCLLYC